MSVLRANLSAVTKSDIYDAFATDINAIWRADAKRRPLGLAISGGVDSMALATLCHKTRTRDRVVVDVSRAHRPTFKAFIVNHNLRLDSRDEASRVADELKKLDIRPEILHLDWSKCGDPQSLPNLESAARRLRYQALGRACREDGVGSLLVAHHADDQAETALIRIVNGYTGIGLSGMKHCASLPECHGIYGVDHSGDTYEGMQNLQAEDGGVKLHRPLLQLRKEQLMNVCREHGVRWFEDHTNADVTLTMRNAVRYLLTDGSALPEALRHSRLLNAAERMGRKKDRSEAEAAKIVSRLTVSLNVRSGQVEFTLNRQTRRHLSQHEEVAGRVLRRILLAVSPKAVISLQDLDQSLALMLGGRMQRDPQYAPDGHIHIAGVQMRRLAQEKGHSTEVSFAISRLLPPRGEQKALTIQLRPHLGTVPESGGWRLWDGRYWIRVQPPLHGAEPGSRVVVKLLNKDGLAKLQDEARLTRQNAAGDALRHLKKIVDPDVRFTLPAVYLIKSNDGSKGAAVGEIVALPSLSWYVAGWAARSGAKRSRLWRCEIRYKHVELRKDQVHDSLSGIEGG